MFGMGENQVIRRLELTFYNLDRKSVSLFENIGAVNFSEYLTFQRRKKNMCRLKGVEHPPSNVHLE